MKTVILRSNGLNRLIQESYDRLNRLLDKEADALCHESSDFPLIGDVTIYGDELVEARINVVKAILELSANNPGRTTWVVGYSKKWGDENVHIFAVDSVRAAFRVVREHTLSESKRLKLSIRTRTPR